jgi:pimeloyl-ACP methyl ester carboxylesterase
MTQTRKRYVLIHGAGSDPWYWHRVVPLIGALGHDVLAPELPSDRDEAGLGDYADAVVASVRDDAPVVVVAQSMGAFTAPLLCERLPVDRITLVCPMIPAPGESAGEWWAATGQPVARRELDEREGRDPEAPFDVIEGFFHDVPADVLAAALARGERCQADTPFAQPWPLERWPRVPTTVIAGRRDRLFPLAFMRRLARTRLGAPVAVIDSGHLPALSRPRALTRMITSAQASA